MTTLLQTSRIDTLIGHAHKLIDRAVVEQGISGFYALFSGGHDSLVSTHISAQHPAFKGVIHIKWSTFLLYPLA